MPDIAKLDPKTSALLTLDCQKGVVDFVPQCVSIFEAAARVVHAARERHIPVIHVGLGFRHGYPEISPDNAMFAMLRQANKFVSGTESADFHESVAPKAGEITIVKHRVSAFSGNDLEMISK